MQNEILWLVMLLVNFFLIIFGYKLFGKWGLIMWIPISVIVANIQVIQTVELFGLVAILGNIVYATSFLVRYSFRKLRKRGSKKSRLDWIFQPDFHDSFNEPGTWI